MPGAGTNQSPMNADELRQAYAMRWKRRRLLWRAFRKRKELTPIADRTSRIKARDVIAFSTVRNEAARLPYFLEHHRKLGVSHFVVVDNASTDLSRNILLDSDDVSVWATSRSYKASRFGMDWLTALQFRFGHGHWCLTVDADELFVYPHWQSRDISALVGHLQDTDVSALGALMIELFPKGRLSTQSYMPGSNPIDCLQWFDAGPYRTARQKPMQNLWVQGGPRDRVFFGKTPQKAPTLNKLPLVKWDRRYVYANSTHSLLPPKLNMQWDGPEDLRLSGALLHTKFLDVVLEKSAEEKVRRQHFGDPESFAGYYDGLVADPDLWHEAAVRYEGWEQLEKLGLMSRGSWS